MKMLPKGRNGALPMADIEIARMGPKTKAKAKVEVKAMANASPTCCPRTILPNQSFPEMKAKRKRMIRRGRRIERI